jgi:hypothetical protein
VLGEVVLGLFVEHDFDLPEALKQMWAAVAAYAEMDWPKY